MSYILTLRLDNEAQAFFDAQRLTYFPPERNFLNAHLTLFHKLSEHKDTIQTLDEIKVQSFFLEVSGFKFLGRGVAYQVESDVLNKLHDKLVNRFKAILIPQDKQGFRPHITIQNKVEPDEAKALLEQLQQNFQPFKIKGLGLDLWSYLGGPWAHLKFFPFEELQP
ncbi:2'-5' RNA ligase family protein [Pedobacter aquatilis]|uniref:2'-5' RNA ligase family protein n=1 Tax=Pedobacter aquatilis TaxID=351343 RepID=UPI0029311494|nr:2'-5' RNA ligase family protein [Pedobacter aquatilis]